MKGPGATHRGPPETCDLRARLALSLPEAAQVIGVSEAHLRRHLSDVPHMHLGGRVLFPVADLQAWLSQRTRAERRGAERAAEEILASLGE